MHDEGNISDKSFDAQEAFSSARAQLVRAEVFLENARIALDDTSVRSPIAGTVISRPAEVGQVITSPTSAVGGGTLLMVMADLNKVRVRAYVDEVDIGKLSNVSCHLPHPLYSLPSPPISGIVLSFI